MQVLLKQDSGKVLEETDFHLPKASIILPAYNEEKKVGATLESLVKSFDHALGRNYEVMVLMDGCTDKTPQIVEEIAKTHSQIVPIMHSGRLGKGGAIIEGFKLSRGDVLIVSDADGSPLSEDLYKLCKLTENYDLVIGSRYSSNSRIVAKEPLLRIFLSRGFNVVLRLMFPRLSEIRDTQCGAKAVKRDALKRIVNDLFVTDFAFDVNLIYAMQLHGFRIKEHGITWKHIDDGSKISRQPLRVAVKMLFSLIRLRVYYSKSRAILNNRFVTRVSNLLYDAF